MFDTWRLLIFDGKHVCLSTNFFVFLGIGRLSDLFFT